MANAEQPRHITNAMTVVRSISSPFPIEVLMQSFHRLASVRVRSVSQADGLESRGGTGKEISASSRCGAGRPSLVSHCPRPPAAIPVLTSESRAQLARFSIHSCPIFDHARHQTFEDKARLYGGSLDSANVSPEELLRRLLRERVPAQRRVLAANGTVGLQLTSCKPRIVSSPILEFIVRCIQRQAQHCLTIMSNRNG